MTLSTKVATKVIQRIRYLIPTVNDVTLQLTGATVFSKLDMSQAYHQLELHEDNRYQHSSRPISL